MEQWFSVPTLIWLFPVAFILHDFEEIIMLEKWLKTQSTAFRRRLSGRLANSIVQHFSMTTAQFAVAVIIIFLFVSSSSYMANQFIEQGPLGNIHFFIAITLAFFIHLFTHLAQSVFLRCITPGAITSLFVIFPYCLILYRSLFTHGIITWTTVLTSLPYTLLVVPVLFAAHWIGKRVLN